MAETLAFVLLAVSTVAAACAAFFSLRAVREARGARREEFYGLVLRRVERVAECVAEVGAAATAGTDAELVRARRNLRIALELRWSLGLPLPLPQTERLLDEASTRAVEDSLREIEMLLRTEIGPAHFASVGKVGAAWDLARSRYRWLEFVDSTPLVRRIRQREAANRPEEETRSE